MERVGKAREKARANAKNLEGNMFNRDLCTKGLANRGMLTSIVLAFIRVELASLLNTAAIDFCLQSHLFNGSDNRCWVYFSRSTTTMSELQRILNFVAFMSFYSIL